MKPGHFLLDEKQGGDQKLKVWIHYLPSTKVPLVIAFNHDKIKESIEVAQEYSEDPNTLMTEVVLDGVILIARFAGYWTGRVYED